MEDEKTRLKHRRARSTVPRSLGLSCKCVLRKGILFLSHLPAQGTRLCREQRAAGTLVSSWEHYLPAGDGSCPGVSARSSKKPSDPKINLWRSSYPAGLERLGMQLGTLPGADYSQQEQKCPLPPALTPPSPLEVSPGCASPHDVPTAPHGGGNPRVDTACRAGVC